jgi:cysteinyl-tRNA synthetase
MTLELTNTMGGKRERFEPLRPGHVSMYHCGPTVKEPASIDKFRSYLLGDLLRRCFELKGLRVTQCMNITDVGHLNEFEEDQVEVAADRSGKQPWELVEEEEALFHRHRKELRILDAHHYPRARENIDAMIGLVETLLARGCAYQAGKNVYFDISKADRFGKLAGRSTRDLEKRACDPRAKPHPEKRHALDIDLWRTDSLHRMHWPSPWGRGYPGWHLECVVMGRKHLGETFDIHTGSQENVYPHHECEIAEAEAAAGKPLARYWMHSAHVLIDGKPVSRSNRNLLTVQGLLDDGVRGVDIRAALLGAHYRRPIEFTPELLDEAHGWVEELGDAARRLSAAPASPPLSAAESSRLDALRRDFHAALDDDLDAPRAIQTALALARGAGRGDTPAHAATRQLLSDFDRVLGWL